jgi:hypothetical protein
MMSKASLIALSSCQLPGGTKILLRSGAAMSMAFKRGDHVEWNSEAGRVRGTVMKRVTSDVAFKGYTHHATEEEPQYFIESDKTDHIAIHKGSALRLLKSSATKRPETTSRKRSTKG